MLRRFFVAGLLLVSLYAVSGCGGGSASGTTPPPPPAGRVTADDYDFTRGVNLGNMLEIDPSNWPIELETEWLALIRAEGFDHVRIPVKWSAETWGSGEIAPGSFRYTERIIDLALAQDLSVILDVHHFDELMTDPAGERERFLAIWDQIAERFKGKSSRLVYELLNEPTELMDDATWNSLVVDGLAAIRRHDATRLVLLATPFYNNITTYSRLQLPDDRYIGVSFHYYLPFHFTHQGAFWLSGYDNWTDTNWDNTTAERNQITSEFTAIKAWADANDVMLHMGEFGTYGGIPEVPTTVSPQNMREAWTRHVRETAESMGIPWTYWEFGAGFGIYDRNALQFRSWLVDALLN